MNKLHRLGTWFLVCRFIGLIVAVALAVVASYRPLNPGLILRLWPPSIVGLADPSTTSAKLLIGLYEFGGNFVLYGLIGAGFSYVLQLGNSMK